jgi:tetratricopeptide (TPR) repeat protein
VAGSGERDLISRLPSQLEIAPNDPLVRQAESIFSTNVRKIVELSERARIPIFVTGIVSNLRDQSPHFQTQSTPEPEDAIFFYRQGREKEAAGDRSGAYEAYRQARDLDVCRYRATSSITQILKSAVADGNPANAKFLDLAPVFEKESQYAAPGSDLFLEHVHFNLDGHWLVARTLGRFIVEEFVQTTWHDSAMPTNDERDEWLGVVPEDNLTGHMLALFLTKEPPFDKAVEADRHQEELSLKIESLRHLNEIPNQAKIDDLVDGLGRSYLKDRQFDRALKLFRIGQRRRPWMQNSFVFAALCLQQMGHSNEAADELAKSDHASLPPSKAIQDVRKELEFKLKMTSAKK